MSRRSRGGGAPISLFSFQDLITSLSGILILLVLLMAVQVALRKAVSVKTSQPSRSTVDITQLKESIATLKRELAILKHAMAASVSQDAVKVAEETTDSERKRGELQNVLDQRKEAQSALEIRLAVAQQKEALRQKVNKPLKAELARLRAALSKAAEESKVFYIPEEGAPKTPILVECSATSIRVGFISREEKPVVFGTDANGVRLFAKHISQYSPTREYFVFMIKPSGIDNWEALKEKAAALNFDVGYDALEEGNNIGFGNERP
jgi:hypothetical protein